MNWKRKLLTPALMLSSVFGGAAMAQEKITLPEAPSATYKLPKPDFTIAAMHKPPVEYTVTKPPSADSSFLKDGFIGRIAGYVDHHSNEAQTPFDFAMEYRVKGPLSVQAGTLADPRTHSGQYYANRMAVRAMTGLPDWQTRGIQNAMSGGIPGRTPRGGDGFAIGIKIQLGGWRR